MDARFFTWIPMPHLPVVPDCFIQRAFELAVPVENPAEESLVKRGSFSLEYKNRIITYRGISQATRAQERFEMGQDWRDWVKKNIVSDFADTDVRLNNGPPGSTIHGAHTDGPLYRLFYLISPGGDNVETIFYQAPNTTKLYANITNAVAGWNNMDELIELDCVKFPVGQWVLHNGYVLHAVRNIIGKRINLNVTLHPEHESLILC